MAAARRGGGRGAAPKGLAGGLAWRVAAALATALSLALALQVWVQRAGPAEPAQARLAAQAAAWTLPLGRQLGVVRPEILETIPHDASCYTQGLVLDPETQTLLESCGHYGKSRLREVDARSGRVQRSQPVDASVFAEGIAVVGEARERVLMLTWREGRALHFDRATLRPHATLAPHPIRTHTGEGWGVASNGTVLAVSDGSEYLDLWDAATLRHLQRLRVTDAETGQPVPRINELEFAGPHELMANIWFDDRIARIDVRTAAVVGWYDLHGVLQRHGDASGRPEVLNGIAFDPSSGDIFVTGKYWKSTFRFQRTPAEE